MCATAESEPFCPKFQGGTTVMKHKKTRREDVGDVIRGRHDTSNAGRKAAGTHATLQTSCGLRTIRSAPEAS